MLGLHLGLTTAGDGLVQRVAAAKYFITRTPPPALAAATTLACAATAATVFKLICNLLEHKINYDSFPFFHFFFRFFIFIYFRSAPVLSVDYFTDGCRHVALALGSRHWMQHMCGNRTVRPKNEALNMHHIVSLTTPSSSLFCLRLVEAGSDACTLVDLLLDAQGMHHSFPLS